MTTFRTVLLGCLVAMAATPVLATDWTMDPEASALRFSGTQTETPFSGQFRRFETEITLDPEDLSTASITVTIDLNSIASGSPDRDTDARTLEWFHTAQFPEAVFTATEVTHVEGNAYLANGVLVIKGIEQAVELPFTLDIEGDAAVAEGTIGLNRLDYNVGVGGEIEDDHFVGHAVTVSFHIEATRAE